MPIPLHQLGELYRGLVERSRSTPRGENIAQNFMAGAGGSLPLPEDIGSIPQIPAEVFRMLMSVAGLAKLSDREKASVMGRFAKENPFELATSVVGGVGLGAGARAIGRRVSKARREAREYDAAFKFISDYEKLEMHLNSSAMARRAKTTLPSVPPPASSPGFIAANEALGQPIRVWKTMKDRTVSADKAVDLMVRFTNLKAKIRSATGNERAALLAEKDVLFNAVMNAQDELVLNANHRTAPFGEAVEMPANRVYIRRPNDTWERLGSLDDMGQR
jgi:hypothetical protein